MAERESNRRKENTARQGVPVEDLKPFARFLLPETSGVLRNGRRTTGVSGMEKETMIKTSYCIE